MYQIGRNSGIVLSFINYFFTVFFYVFVGNGASNASQLSRNKVQEEGGTGGMFNRSIIQYFFTTKLSYEIVEEFFIR